MDNTDDNGEVYTISFSPPRKLWCRPVPTDIHCFISNSLMGVLSRSRIYREIGMAWTMITHIFQAPSRNSTHTSVSFQNQGVFLVRDTRYYANTADYIRFGFSNPQNVCNIRPPPLRPKKSAHQRIPIKGPGLNRPSSTMACGTLLPTV